MNKLARSIAAAGAALACLGAAAADKELLIGVNDSLTGPGAVYGLPQANSVQMAADEINAAGGIKAGGDVYKLRVIANAAEHQQLGGVDATRADNHLGVGADGFGASGGGNLHAGDLGAGKGQPVHMGVHQNGDIGP